MMKYLVSSTLLPFLVTAPTCAFQQPQSATIAIANFVSNVTPTTSSTTSTTLYMEDSSTFNVPRGEASRLNRRTVYTHNDWYDPKIHVHIISSFSLTTVSTVTCYLSIHFYCPCNLPTFFIFIYYFRVKHRSPDRFLRNLATIPASGIYKNMFREILATTTVATLIFFWNMLTSGYDDFNQVHHEAIIQSYYLPPIKLPLAPFTLASSSLGLLLGTYKWRFTKTVKREKE
jgi:hypothetical protein